MSDLLAELKAERAKHEQVAGMFPPACKCSPWWPTEGGGQSWPCPLSRALDGMIAGVEGHGKITRMNLAASARIANGFIVGQIGPGRAASTEVCICGLPWPCDRLEAMARAYRGDDGKEK